MSLCIFNRILCAVLILLPVQLATGQTEDQDRQKIEFFETRIRPVLIEHCYACHNSVDTAESDLALDSRAGLLKGGDQGKVIVAGNPDKSRLLQSMRHEIVGLEMPEDGAKLDDRVLADFEKWITDGAVDPRDAPPTQAELAAATSWPAKLAKRKQWWSLQPISSPVPPETSKPKWTNNAIDKFIIDKIDDKGLVPADLSEPETLVRRLYFNLIGLPPEPEACLKWSQLIRSAETDEKRQDIVTQLVDELLQNPHFGERWARHWMDWIRYAESHGSEGDPEIVNAWLYRDYLIRALNQDIPFDQLIREHVAGDLLKQPRIDANKGINESIIGTAHWRMVFHGFAPTDALDEKVRFIDDQINSFSKAFLGMTVSCARCHDHKFDAIGQDDYYALFGVLGSCRPGRNVIELPDRLNLNRQKLIEMKPLIRAALANHWQGELDSIQQRVIRSFQSVNDLKSDPNSLLFPLAALKSELNDYDRLTVKWIELGKRIQKSVQHDELVRQLNSKGQNAWDLSNPRAYGAWYKQGIALDPKPDVSGDFAVSPEGKGALLGIYPGGAYTHLVSTKHGGRLTSKDFTLKENQEVWIQTVGDASTFRYVVQDYPRNGTVYPVPGIGGNWQWKRLDLDYWSGDSIHLEVTTAADAPLLARNQPRSWFGVRKAIVCNKGEFQPPENLEHLSRLFEKREKPPRDAEQWGALYRKVIEDAIIAWEKGTADDQQAMLLDACLKQGWFSNSMDQLGKATALLTTYRQLEKEIPVATRVPGLDETIGTDQPLFVRGNHKTPADPVPRGFLAAIEAKPYTTQQSGRLELANNLLNENNPLTRRVLVNRIWHHLFGKGIVTTPDNFGKLGGQPSHPELLDFLAIQFAKDEWSLKKTIRRIVLTRTWQLDSRETDTTRARDPENRYLSRSSIRRLEAEAIRDQLLAVSGKLDRTLFGPPVGGNSNRRSIYVAVRRNSLNQFLRVFDFPEPFATVGRRDVTNVPAQPLALLNSPMMSAYADGWASQLLAPSGKGKKDLQVEETIKRMFLASLGRPPTLNEIEKARAFLDSTRQDLVNRKRESDSMQIKRKNLQAELEKIIEPIRRQLKESLGRNPNPKTASIPIAEWDFKKSLKDQIGSADVVLKGGAERSQSGLIVRNGGYAITPPLKMDLQAKTLEVWVQLDNLQQRNGGVMSIQTPDGITFDAIVYAEQQPRKWLAGSNSFVRTQSFNGSDEKQVDRSVVHLAWVYESNGMISAYRNGQPYGKSYQSKGPFPFRAGQSVITFGLRHLPAVPGRFLSGTIEKARLYDKALSPESIALNARSVTRRQIEKAMSEPARDRVREIERQLADLDNQMKQQGPVVQSISDQLVWTELAHAIFTFQEFIYVR